MMVTVLVSAATIERVMAHQRILHLAKGVVLKRTVLSAKLQTQESNACQIDRSRTQADGTEPVYALNLEDVDDPLRQRRQIIRFVR
jgi:hypothetical protein